MRFDFLGQFVLGGDRPAVTARGHQPALTVARLVLDRPSPLRREELAELLWPEDRPARWEGPARQVVSRARALLVDRRGAADVRHVSRRPRRAPSRAARSRSTSSAPSHETAGGRAAALPAATGSAPTTLPTHALERLRLPFFPASDAAWTRRWQDRVRAPAPARAPHRRRRRARRRRARARRSRSPRRRSVWTRSTRWRPARSMSAYEALGSRGKALTAYERCRRSPRRGVGRAPGGRDRGGLPRAARQRAASQRPSGRRGRGTPTRAEPLPFVGRQAELARLDVDWDAVRDGDTRAVVITGDPGIGKTRLAAEIAQRRAQRRRARALGRVPRRRRAAVPAVRRARETTRERTALGERPSRRASRPISRRCVPELIDDTESSGRTSDEQRAIPAVPRGDERLRRRCGTNPLVIVLDDLQFAGRRRAGTPASSRPASPNGRACS